MQIESVQDDADRLDRVAAITNHPNFDNTLPELVEYDDLYNERIHSVRSRVRRIAALTTN